MSYENGDLMTYTFPATDFGASDVTKVIAVPPDGPNSASPGTGRRGRVVGATIREVTENFAGSTSDAGVRVGDGSDDDVYFDSGLVLDENVDIGESVFLKDDGSQIDIPAGRSDVTVTMVASVGTPTGIATVDLHVLWFGPDGGRANN